MNKLQRNSAMKTKPRLQKGGALIEIKRKDLGRFVRQDIFIEIGWNGPRFREDVENNRNQNMNFKQFYGFQDNILDPNYVDQWHLIADINDPIGDDVDTDEREDDDGRYMWPKKIKCINLQIVENEGGTNDYIRFSDFKQVDEGDVESEVAALTLKKIQEFGAVTQNDNMLDIHWFYENNSPFYIKFFLSTDSYIDIKNSTKRAITHKLKGDQDHYFEPDHEEPLTKEQLSKQFIKTYKKLRNEGLTTKEAMEHIRRGRGLQIPGSMGGLWNGKGILRADIPRNILDFLVLDMDKKIKDGQKMGGKKKKRKKTRRKTRLKMRRKTRRKTRLKTRRSK